MIAVKCESIVLCLFSLSSMYHTTFNCRKATVCYAIHLVLHLTSIQGLARLHGVYDCLPACLVLILLLQAHLEERTVFELGSEDFDG